MRIFPAARIVPGLLAVVVLAGCGADDDPTGSGSEDTAPPAPTAIEPSPSPTASATPTKKAKPTQKPSPSPAEPSDDGGGDGDADRPDTEYAAGGGVCADLEAGDVERILGGPVQGDALDSGGCLFAQSNRRAPQATIVDRAWSRGGMDRARDEATSAVEGTPRKLAGVGKEAFVVSGTIFGQPDIQAAGAVHVGSRLVSAYVVHHQGLARDEVEGMVIQLLRLAVDELR